MLMFGDAELSQQLQVVAQGLQFGAPWKGVCIGDGEVSIYICGASRGLTMDNR